MLSDPQRRREYDRLSSSRPSSERTSDPNASGNFFRTFASMFSSGAGNGQAGTGTEQPGQRPNADHVFGDVFEEVSITLSSPPPLSTLGEDRSHTPSFFPFPHPQLLRPEVERHLPLWSWLGAACGAGLGFITANVPGLVVGAYTGNRLGAIRDAKGKSVAAVFSELGGAQKAEVRRKRLRAARPNSALITRPAYRSCARSP